MKDGTRIPGTEDEVAHILAFDRQLLSYRQTAEWGMWTMQGSFGRLRIPLQIAYKEARGDLLETCTRLFNLRTRRVGHNQIRSVYMPIWRENQDLEAIWTSFETLLFSDQRKNDRVSRFHLIAATT